MLAFSGVACLAVAGLAAAGGESSLAVGLAVAAALLALGVTGRDALGTPPSTAALLVVAVVCGLGALVSLPNQRWFTAAALAGVGAMNFLRANDRWVPEAERDAE